MANITKPTDINKIWSSAGDVLAPSDTKIASGWGVEIPPRQYVNYIDGKQDQAIAHINQHGIAIWDSTTEYQATTSYTQGSDGVIYQAVTTNTNINPTTDTSHTNWKVAFLQSVPSKGVQTFIASGTFTVPTGVTAMWVSAVAGGGGGGAGAGSTSSSWGGGGAGGSAGQSVQRVPVVVTPGSTLTITIGAAGAGGAAGVGLAGGQGGSGGTTSMSGISGSPLSLTGGAGGGVFALVSSNFGPGGLARSPGYPLGSDGCDATQGQPDGCGGVGASTPFGGGGGAGRAVAFTTGLAGKDAYGYGAGGGGGGASYSPSSPPVAGGSGGAGSAGIIILEW